MGDTPADTDPVLLKYSALMARIAKMELEEAYAFKTILNVSRGKRF